MRVVIVINMDLLVESLTKRKRNLHSCLEVMRMFSTTITSQLMVAQASILNRHHLMKPQMLQELAEALMMKP